MACQQISNRAYIGLDKQTHKAILQSEPWITDPNIISGLIDALSDQSDNWAGRTIAYILIKCGIRDPNVIACLEPWKQLIFLWRNSGITTSIVFNLIGSMGFFRQDEESLRTIDDWINDPLVPIDSDCVGEELLWRLFGDRIIIYTVRDSGSEPDHGDLLDSFAQAAVPPVVIEETSQEISETKGVRTYDHYVVRFRHNDTTYMFRADCSDMDTDTVVHQFNQFMKQIGREEDVFRFELPNSSDGYFVVANREQFEQINKRLRLPLTRSATPRNNLLCIVGRNE
jgi:hypothetical protein